MARHLTSKVQEPANARGTPFQCLDCAVSNDAVLYNTFILFCYRSMDLIIDVESILV